MHKKYPGAAEESIDLLNKMLQFNPYFRISIEDALEHSCFEKLRKDKCKERVASHTIEIDFEGEQLDRESLRELFIRLVSECKQDNTLRKRPI